MPRRRLQYQIKAEPLPVAAAAAPAGPPSLVYPDRFQRPALSIAELPFLFFVPTEIPAAPTFLAAVYPDRVPRPTFPVSEQQFLAVLFAPPTAAPDLSWLPGYPDRLVRPGPSAPRQEAFFGPPTPTVAAAPGLMAPVYPDQLRARTFPVSQQSFLAFVFPPPTVAPTDLAWLSTYPHQLMGRFFPTTEQQSLAYVQQPEVVPPAPVVVPFRPLWRTPAHEPVIPAPVLDRATVERALRAEAAKLIEVAERAGRALSAREIELIRDLDRATQAAASEADLTLDRISQERRSLERKRGYADQPMRPTPFPEHLKAERLVDQQERIIRQALESAQQGAVGKAIEDLEALRLARLELEQEKKAARSMGSR
ncbi:MAG: hypothetical protein ACRDHG_14995, partial [Anaerolineales bacterium]